MYIGGKTLLGIVLAAILAFGAYWVGGMWEATTEEGFISLVPVGLIAGLALALHLGKTQTVNTEVSKLSKKLFGDRFAEAFEDGVLAKLVSDVRDKPSTADVTRSIDAAKDVTRGLIADAVGPLNTRVDDLTSRVISEARIQELIDAAVANATRPLKTQIAELQASRPAPATASRTSTARTRRTASTAGAAS